MYVNADFKSNQALITVTHVICDKTIEWESVYCVLVPLSF